MDIHINIKDKNGKTVIITKNVTHIDNSKEEKEELILYISIS